VKLEERGAKVTWYEGLLVASGQPIRLVPDVFSSTLIVNGLVCTGPERIPNTRRLFRQIALNLTSNNSYQKIDV